MSFITDITMLIMGKYKLIIFFLAQNPITIIVITFLFKEYRLNFILIDRKSIIFF